MLKIIPFLIPLLLIGGTLVYILRYWARAKKAVTSLPTINQYLEQNPECRKGDRIACSQCGGTNIYMWWLYGPQSGQGPKKHLCKACGSALWHST